jgi:hypothetical protein
MLFFLLEKFRKDASFLEPPSWALLPARSISMLSKSKTPLGRKMEIYFLITIFAFITQKYILNAILSLKNKNVVGSHDLSPLLAQASACAHVQKHPLLAQASACAHVQKHKRTLAL